MQQVSNIIRGTVSFATLGCKTNQFESTSMQEQLEKAGYRVIPFEEGAELVIVNTCTVTSATDSQSRNLVRRARRANPACRVVVTGCYAQIDPDALSTLPGVSVVIGNEEKQKLLEYLQVDPEAPVVDVSDARATQTVCLPPLTSFAGRSRAFVQIQNGCDAFCSYCIIPYARGASRSAAPGEVTAQVQALVEAGYPEVVLTGIHIGGYGKDLAVATDLTDLVSRVEQETDLRRLRLGSIEPTEIPDQLIELIAGSQIVCHHFHIPLQSGDDQVLRRMGRPYDRNFFRALIQRIRDRVPDAGIGLDVITGFPGETDAEFNKTVKLIEELPVSYLHVFPYSRRPGTPAADMPGQVPGDVNRERAEKLRDLSRLKQDAFAGNFVGTRLEVVVESGRAAGLMKGVARNYLDVRMDGPDSLSGRCVMVDITDVVGGRLLGQWVEP